MSSYRIREEKDNIFEIYNYDILLSLIIKKEYSSEGISFFTDQNMSQQLGYMNRPSGYEIQPHIHLPVHREVTYTQEVLFIKKGKVKINFYDKDKNFIGEFVVSTGDCVFLADGGHGFEFLEKSEIIEVKQGPYSGENDKERFKK
tara:strand:+ start:79 stop:513 length:435 start_codon:yes stop_codon:yes gene_type:complete